MLGNTYFFVDRGPSATKWSREDLKSKKIKTATVGEIVKIVCVRFIVNTRCTLCLCVILLELKVGSFWLWHRHRDRRLHIIIHANEQCVVCFFIALRQLTQHSLHLIGFHHVLSYQFSADPHYFGRAEKIGRKNKNDKNKSFNKIAFYEFCALLLPLCSPSNHLFRLLSTIRITAYIVIPFRHSASFC